MGNSSDRLTVKMGLKLSQIIGVDMKRQIMITNVWVEQVKNIVFLKVIIRLNVCRIYVKNYYILNVCAMYIQNFRIVCMEQVQINFFAELGVASCPLCLMLVRC